MRLWKVRLERKWESGTGARTRIYLTLGVTRVDAIRRARAEWPTGDDKDYAVSVIEQRDPILYAEYATPKPKVRVASANDG